MSKHLEKEGGDEKTKVRKYPPPPVSCSFPQKVNLFFEKGVSKGWQEWTFRVSGLPPKIRDKSKNTEVAYAAFYIFCDDLDRYECLVKSGILFFFYDDKAEENYKEIDTNLDKAIDVWKDFGQIIDKLEASIEGNFVSMKRWESLTLGLYAIMEEIFNEYNDIQKKRFIRLWRRLLEAQIYEAKMMGLPRKTMTFDQFMKLRIPSIANEVCIQLIEYADQIFVPEHVWNDPRWQTLLELAGKHWILINDIYSFEKEFNHVQSLEKMVNLVACFSIWDGISIEESMKKVAQMSVDTEKEIYKIGNEFMGEEDCLPVTKQFIEGIYVTCGGNFLASTLMDRYHKLTYSWRPIE